MIDELHKKVMDATAEHARILDERIKKVIAELDCKPSDIELQCHPEFHYKILVKMDEFKFNYNFVVRGEE